MKRTLLCLVAGLVPLLSPLAAHAAGCERFFQKWGDQLHPGREILIDDPPHGVRGAICKVWPANEALTLAVLPFPQAGSNDDEATFDLEVLVADTASGKIIAHTFEKSAITSDADRFSSLVLDTARYQLAPGKRAFGIRIDHEGSSRPYPFDEEALNLYVIDGQHVRKVLDRLVVEKSNGEWDTICAGHFTDVTRTLDIGPKGEDGYAALKITEKTVDTVDTVNTANTAKDDPCISKKTSGKTSTFTLDYRNGQYVIPRALKSDL